MYIICLGDVCMSSSGAPFIIVTIGIMPRWKLAVSRVWSVVWNSMVLENNATTVDFWDIWPFALLEIINGWTYVQHQLKIHQRLTLTELILLGISYIPEYRDTPLPAQLFLFFCFFFFFLIMSLFSCLVFFLSFFFGQKCSLTEAPLLQEAYSWGWETVKRSTKSSPHWLQGHELSADPWRMCVGCTLDTVAPPPQA